GPLGGALTRILAGRMMAMQGYLHSDDSSHLVASIAAADSRGALRLEGIVNPAARKTIRRLTRKLLAAGRHTGAYPALPMLHVGAPGDGRHAGGSFPMRREPGPFETDLEGRPRGCSRIHVVDSSVFPSVPASTITYTVMANAWRIAEVYAGGSAG